jgi:sec-independent protein translocase protein TatA
MGSLPGLPEMLLILGVVVLLFGGKKLPELGSALGESIKNFKKGIKDEPPALPKTEAKPQEQDPATKEEHKA